MKKLLFTFFIACIALSACNAPSGEDPQTENAETTIETNQMNVPTQTTASREGEPFVNIKNFQYQPVTLTVSTGTTVVWENNDTVLHTVTSNDGTGTLDSGRLSQGETYSYTFSTPGTYTYYCAIHPNMRGTIIVTDSEA